MKPEFEKIINKFHDGKYPVQVVDLAKEIGYDVMFFYPKPDMVNIAGMVNYTEKKIFVNDKDCATRKLFTIAHEIGHICLGHDEDAVVTEEGVYIDYRKNMNNPSDQKERDANAFAANLLMPESDFIKSFKYLNKLHDMNEDKVVDSLSEIFGCSMAAVSMRIWELDLFSDFELYA